MKTITIYELLGMVKDGKAPKKIKYHDNIYFADYGNWYRYYDEKGSRHDFLNVLYEDFSNLNEPVEILEEEKKIPEKLESYISCGWNGTCKDLKRDELFEDLKKIGNKINEIIDYLDYLKSKGDE